MTRLGRGRGRGGGGRARGGKGQAEEERVEDKHTTRCTTSTMATMTPSPRSMLRGVPSPSSPRGGKTAGAAVTSGGRRRPDARGDVRGENRGDVRCENRGEIRGEARGENRGEANSEIRGGNRSENRGEKRAEARGENRGETETRSEGDGYKSEEEAKYRTRKKSKATSPLKLRREAAMVTEGTQTAMVTEATQTLPQALVTTPEKAEVPTDGKLPVIEAKEQGEKIEVKEQRRKMGKKEQIEVEEIDHKKKSNVKDVSKEEDKEKSKFKNNFEKRRLGDSNSKENDSEESKTEVCMAQDGKTEERKPEEEKEGLELGAESAAAPWISPATGLACLAVASPGHAISLATRRNLVRHFGPGLVILNTAGRGDKLELGLELEEGRKLVEVLGVVERELPGLSIRPMVTSARDPFSWVPRLASIPRVGGTGLYQVAVRRPPPSDQESPRKAELAVRKELAAVTARLDSVAKVVHGEGESLVQVGHMLQAVAFAATIGRSFPTKLQFVWQPREAGGAAARAQGGGERHYLVTLAEGGEEGGPLQRQLLVNHQLSGLGRVVHLEQGLFGSSHHFLAVVEQGEEAEEAARVEEGLHLLEVAPGCLPDQFVPTHVVNELGFYVVGGAFPAGARPEAKDRFAREMQELGAVGFRRGEVEHSFSLQFVHSGGLGRACRSPAAARFALAIQSQARAPPVVPSPPPCAALHKLEKGRNAEEERGVKVAKNCEKLSDPKVGKCSKEEAKVVKLTGDEAREGDRKEDANLIQVKNIEPLFQSTDIRKKRKSSSVSEEELKLAMKEKPEDDSEKEKGKETELKSVEEIKQRDEEANSGKISPGVNEFKEARCAETKAAKEDLDKSKPAPEVATKVVKKPRAEKRKDVGRSKEDAKMDSNVEETAVESKKVEAVVESEAEQFLQEVEKESDENPNKTEANEAARNDEVPEQLPATLTEAELLSVRWRRAGSLPAYLASLAAFLAGLPGLQVLEAGQGLQLRFPDVEQLEVSAGTLWISIRPLVQWLLELTKCPTPAGPGRRGLRGHGLGAEAAARREAGGSMARCIQGDQLYWPHKNLAKSNMIHDT